MDYSAHADSRRPSQVASDGTDDESKFGSADEGGPCGDDDDGWRRNDEDSAGSEYDDGGGGHSRPPSQHSPGRSNGVDWPRVDALSDAAGSGGDNDDGLDVAAVLNGYHAVKPPSAASHAARSRHDVRLPAAYGDTEFDRVLRVSGPSSRGRDFHSPVVTGRDPSHEQQLAPHVVDAVKSGGGDDGQKGTLEVAHVTAEVGYPPSARRPPTATVGTQVDDAVVDGGVDRSPTTALPVVRTVVDGGVDRSPTTTLPDVRTVVVHRPQSAARASPLLDSMSPCDPLGGTGKEFAAIAMAPLPDDLRVLVDKQRALQDRISKLEAMDASFPVDALSDSLDLGDSVSLVVE